MTFPATWNMSDCQHLPVPESVYGSPSKKHHQSQEGAFRPRPAIYRKVACDKALAEKLANVSRRPRIVFIDYRWNDVNCNY